MLKACGHPTFTKVGRGVGVSAAHSREETLDAMKRRGIRLPRHQGSQEEYANRVAESLSRLEGQSAAVSNYKKVASTSSNVTFSLPRYFDPQATLDGQFGKSFFDMNDENIRKQVGAWCRLFEATHPIIGAAIDIYSRFPVAGMDMVSDDRALDRFYTELFLEDLELQDHFIDMGKEHWCVGEAISLGDWDSTLGIWTGEELLWPDDVEIERIPMVGEDFYYLVPQEELKTLVNSQQPREQYLAFEAQFPDLIPYLRANERIPVNSEVISHIARRSNRRDSRGTPILVRGFKTLMLEDRLEGAMQAVADRLYSPLLMFKLGIEKFGDNEYWLPSPGQIEGFKQQLDLALSSEFRAMVTHFGIDVQSAFGREMMPSYKNDRDMIDERLFMVFGLSADMLKGSSGQPYASSALRMEFVSQMLGSYQKLLLKHYNKRAQVVAEAQGHYEVEKKGDMLLPVYERFLVVDDEGNKKIEERPKLHWPELRFQTMDMRDEQSQRNFLKEVKALGVPIADADLMVGVEYDFDESLRRAKDEAIKKKIAAAEEQDVVSRALENKGIDPNKSVENVTVIDTSELDTSSGGGGNMNNLFPFSGGGDEEVEDPSATGGGGRPNISDEYPRVAREISIIRKETE